MESNELSTIEERCQKILDNSLGDWKPIVFWRFLEGDVQYVSRLGKKIHRLIEDASEIEAQSMEGRRRDPKI